MMVVCFFFGYENVGNGSRLGWFMKGFSMFFGGGGGQ